MTTELDATAQTNADSPADAPEAQPTPPADTAQTEGAQPQTTEYDVTAIQRVPVRFILGEEVIPLTLTLDPNAQGRSIDYHIQEYARRAVPAEDAETDESLAAARESAQVEAMGYLFNTLMTKLEGLDGLPTDWRSIFSPKEKQSIVERSLFAVQVVAPTLSRRHGRPMWGEQFRHSTIRLRSFFDGRDVDTVHVLRKPDASLLRDFNATLAKAYVTGPGDAAALELVPFWDKLRVEARNYKQGIVPVHHKAMAVLSHLLRQAQVVRKN